MQRAKNNHDNLEEEQIWKICITRYQAFYKTTIMKNM